MYNLFLSLVLILGGSSAAEFPTPSDKALILVVNTADWCPVCQKNGERVEKELLSDLMENQKYLVIVNDLSNDESKAASQKKLEAAGLANFTAENNGTGRIYMINPESKEVVDKVSVRKSTEKLLKKIEEAQAEL